MGEKISSTSKIREHEKITLDETNGLIKLLQRRHELDTRERVEEGWKTRTVGNQIVRAIKVFENALANPSHPFCVWVREHVGVTVHPTSLHAFARFFATYPAREQMRQILPQEQTLLANMKGIGTSTLIAIEKALREEGLLPSNLMSSQTGKSPQTEFDFKA